MSGAIRSILVVELLGGIGDLLLALPAIHALARTYPDATLSVLTFAPGSSLLATDPHVTKVHVAEPGPPAQQARAVAALLRRRFDLVVSDTRYGGIPALIEAAPGRAVTDLWRHPPADARIDQRFLALLRDDGVIDAHLAELPPRVFLTDEELREGASLVDQARPTALLIPDAGMRIKEWAPLRFRILAQRLVREHDLAVLVADGGRADVATAVVGGVEHARILPRRSLRQFAAVAAACACAVGADTGPSRLAAAVGTPTVALYGPTWAGRFGLRPRHASVQARLPCDVRDPRDQTRQPCWYSGECVLANHRTCMDAIAVEDVLDALDRAKNFVVKCTVRPG